MLRPFLYYPGNHGWINGNGMLVLKYYKYFRNRKPIMINNHFIRILHSVLLIHVAIIILFIACKGDTVPVGLEPGDYERSLTVNSVTRWYKVVIPQNYDHTVARPLLFCFHGGNNSMKTFFNKRKDLIERCEQENWILVFPNGSDNKENKGLSVWKAIHCCPPAINHDIDEIGFVEAMIEELTDMLKIDVKRIYIMGGSNGGMLTHKLAAEIPEYFAAAAPVSSTVGGQIDANSPKLTVTPIAPIPIMLTHGMSDGSVMFHGGQSSGKDRIDISFLESTMLWVQNNQCSVGDADTIVLQGSLGNVNVIDFATCNASTRVRALAIQNHGHGWPSLENSGFDGTNSIVDFLKQFSK